MLPLEIATSIQRLSTVGLNNQIYKKYKIQPDTFSNV
jgi:hypothetical protein